MQIRTVVADNNPTSRNIVHSVLASDPTFTIVADCLGPTELKAAIQRNGPDLAFLDVEMMNQAGARQLRSLYADMVSTGVLIRPRDRYANFKLHPSPVGQLLRPFTKTDLLSVCQTCKAYISARRVIDTQDSLRALVDRAARLCAGRRKLVIRSAGRLIFVKPDEIDWIEADKNYVRVHIGADCHTQRATLGAVEQTLDPSQFLRIHRSVIVNINKIRELRPWPTGEYVVMMSTRKELTLSRGYRTCLPFLVQSHDRLGHSTPLDGIVGKPSKSALHYSGAPRKLAIRWHARNVTY